MREPPPAEEEILQELFLKAKKEGKASRLLQHGISEEEPGIAYVAFQLGHRSYVIPHCHPNTKETFLHLRGILALILFDETGKITHRHTLGLGGRKSLIAPEGTNHTLVALTQNAAIATIFHGAYEPKQIPEWAIPENAGEARIEKYMCEFLTTKLD